MSNLLFPVGRLVQGSLYKAKTTDAEGKPILFKTGSKAGQPRSEFYLGVAIPKGAERHWNETTWGKQIIDVATLNFPKGETKQLNFAWKILDGDSTVPNSKGVAPLQKQGYAKHWIVNFAGSFAPAICDTAGRPTALPENAINAGDYIQVYAKVRSNGSALRPGLYFNPSSVAFIGYGERIVLGADLTAIPWSKEAPPGVKATPTVATAAVPPSPYPEILTPQPPPAHRMTDKANGVTYEQFIANGWTDQQLIQNGYMRV